MSFQQKQAWFTLVVCAVGLVAFLALIPAIGPERASGAFGICGLVGVPILYVRCRRPDLQLDERDQIISRRAQLVGYRIFWVSFVAACMLLYGTFRYAMQQALVPVDYFPGFVIGAWVLFMVSSSIATLVQYGRSHAHEE